MIIRKVYNEVYKKLKPIDYAKKIGVHMGENCRVLPSTNWGSEPWLIWLGNHVEVSYGCSFITHDGGTWVFRDKERYKDVIKFGKIVIGDNCFIGANSIILPDVCIGDNAVVAAGAVVVKNIPSGEVWGGNPAHFISTTEQYAEKSLANLPEYDKENFINNKKEEVLKMLRCENKML